MALNRSRRICLLLTLTAAFFFVELAVGYATSSIALIADSFHMLSDVLSMVIALYAIKLGKCKDRKAQFTYGWQRAEILGALINGVFLLALSFAIFLQAVERFFEPVEIRSPVAVLSVGAAGLIMNIIGLALFHEHGHSHTHGHSRKASLGKSEGVGQELLEPPIADVSKVVVMDGDDTAEIELVVEGCEEKESVIPAASMTSQSSECVTLEVPTTPFADEKVPRQNIPPSAPREGRKRAGPHRRWRQRGGTLRAVGSHGESRRTGHVNMRGVFLHVLGDALGSVGVIVAGLFIWLTDYPWRFYVDPVITLLITCIIFSSTIPLVRSTCSILLQGVPSSIRVEDVHAKITKIDDVVSIHELHLWTLSEHVWIASVHVKVSPSNFMRVATDIKRLMHHYGIHSTTVQPEFVHEVDSVTTSDVAPGEENQVKEANERDSGEDSCLLRCAEACTTTSVCCPP